MHCINYALIGAVWGLLLRQLMLAMLALARCCLILFFSLVVLSGPVGLCNDPGPPVSLLGAVTQRLFYPCPFIAC